VWKEFTVASIETSVNTSGCREGETKQKLGSSSALVAQSTLMIKKKLCKIGIGLIMLSFNSFSP